MVSAVPRGPGFLGLFLLLLSLCAGCDREPRRPNLLVISIDTLRADHLGAYGYGRDTSPAIDAVARGGAVFLNAWSTTSWTLPSHVSMLTGLPISAHAQCDFDMEATQAVESHRPRGRFVSEDLAMAGYDTAGFYSCVYLEPACGFGPGFETWERAYHSFKTEPGIAERWKAARESGDEGAMRRIAAERPELFDLEIPTAPAAVDGALGWLDRRGKDADPFFLFLHVYDVHTPYTPPAPFDRSFDPDYAGTIDGRRLGGSDSPVRADMDPRDLAHVIALYDGEIAAVDRELSRLFAELERRGLSHETPVVITSDHGEEFFEHGAKLHGGHLYRETLQVPLIVVWPGKIPAGVRRSECTGLIDLVPTLRAAAGLAPDPILPGIDLSAVAQGKWTGPARTLTASLVIRRGVSEPQWLSSIVDNREQTIIHRPGAPDWHAERFDLVANPRELSPPEVIDPEHPDAAALEARLGTVRAHLRGLREAAPRREVQGLPLEDVERARLEQLGYGGSARDGQHGGEALCFDGCIWHP